MQTRTAEQLLEALTVEKANINTYRTQLGLTEADVTACTEDHANLTAALDNVDVVEADKKGVTQVKNLVYSGDPNITVEPYPSFTLTALPFPDVKAGSLSRYNNRKGRAKLAAAYTTQIGMAMGYEDTPPDPISPELLNAALKSYKNLGSYQLEAAFAKQGMSGMVFQYRLKGAEKWLDIKTALQSPATFGIPPQPDDAAVEIELRCRLLNGNQQVGNWSPIYSMVLTS